MPACWVDTFLKSRMAVATLVSIVSSLCLSASMCRPSTRSDLTSGMAVPSFVLKLMSGLVAPLRLLLRNGMIRSSDFAG